MQKKLETIANGVAQQNLSPIETGKIETILPNSQDMKYFAEACNPLLNQILLLFVKNGNLRRTRDLLLPKLISGEIDVSKLDIKTKEEN
jgi:type I restriction enzyme S subunit